jgi:hypothetical protein
MACLVRCGWAQCLVLLTSGGCSGLTSLGCLLIQ